MKTMEYKYTKMQKHPLRDCYMVWIPLSSIPPYFGTKKQCEKARQFAEKKAIEILEGQL